MIEQLSLLSHGLAPLPLNARVRTPAGWVGVVAQIWPGRDWYAVYTTPWRGPMDKGLPVFRRDELEALPIVDDDEERAAVARICHPQSDRS